MQNEPNDPINPNHYKKGGIECINYLKAKLSPEEFKGFLRGNVIKYLTRGPEKQGVQDYEKAKWYLNRLIQETANEEAIVGVYVDQLISGKRKLSADDVWNDAGHRKLPGD